MQVVEFDIRTPNVDLAAQVASAIARELPELPRLPERSDTLNIVANGPTAHQAPMEGVTLAINGALRLFAAKGIAPTYWAACDPQEMVADFLDDAPEETIYLVCSKCHPKVFDRLKDRKVFVWHIDDFETWNMVEHRDPIMTATSITIVSFEVMARLGFSKFETWGWDGCFVDGMAHATSQPASMDCRTIEVGDKSFASTTTWALEAQEAFTKLRFNPYELKINGGGMIGAVFAYLAA